MTIENKQLPFQGLNDHDAFSLEPQFSANVRNVRSFRERIVRAPGGTQLAPPPLPGISVGIGMEAGTFHSNTSTGNQTISHTLGATPVALILYTFNTTANNTFRSNIRYSMGVTDGTTSRAIGAAANSSGAAARRYANAIISFTNGAGTLTGEAAFVSFSSTDFVINWTTADSTSRIVNYIIIGNTALSCKLVEWTLGTSTGNQSVTGVGFTPQAVLHLTNALSSASTSTSGMQLGTSWMGTNGVAASTIAIRNSGGSHTTGTSASTSQAIEVINSTVTGYEYTAEYVSMDADGFTVNVKTAPATGRLVASLCFDGFSNVKVGAFVTSPAISIPGNATTPEPGFQATGAIGFGPNFSDTDPGDIIVTSSADFQVGCMDGVHQMAGALTDGKGSVGNSSITNNAAALV